MSDNNSLLHETHGMPWAPEATGVARRLLAHGDDQDSHTTSIVRLAPGASLPPSSNGWGREIVVVDGTLILEDGPLQAGDYSRRPPNSIGVPSTETGCTLFVKDGPFEDLDQEAVHLRVGEMPWVPGHGNLRVKPLHSFGTTGTALVHWPVGERFIPHRHWGGEEILVLSGTFQDEHGRYPKGTWLRSPHLSSHHPFVEEETVTFVKTGHLQDATQRASV